jgi:HAE1 family hydrophobic/amphiphilic exporter-1
MSIYKNAVNKPITTILIFVAVVVMGVFSLMQVPIDGTPIHFGNYFLPGS